MARKSQLHLTWTQDVVPNGATFDLVILGQSVRFVPYANFMSMNETPTTVSPGIWSFPQDYSGAGALSPIPAWNWGKLCEAVRLYLASVGLDDTYEVAGEAKYVDLLNALLNRPNRLIVRALTYDASLDFAASTIGGGWTATETRYTALLPPAVEATVTDAICFASATADVELAVSGGMAPYTYLWSSGQTTQTINGVPAGTYTVTVTDAVPGPPTLSNSWQEPGVTVLEVLVGENSRIEAEIRRVNDNLYLTVRGGTAPYYYTWSDGPTTRDRTGVAPGFYTVVIRDSAGCGASLSVTVEPYQFFFSQNPVTLPLDAGEDYRDDPSTKPNLVFECGVFVEDSYGSETWSQLGPTLQQPPDARGLTTFDVASLLDTVVTPFVPDLANRAVVRADSVFRRFYLRWREVTDDGASAYVTLDFNFVVWGGLSFQEYAAGTFFSGYQKTVKPFFSWEPTTKDVLPEQPEYLFFQANSATLSGLLCKVRVYFTNNTSEERTFATISPADRYELWCLPVGYHQRADVLATNLRGRRVEKWEVYVTTAAGALLTQVRTYVLDRRYYEFRRYILYANSLGGINTLALVGMAERKLGTKTQVSDRFLPPNYDPLLGDQQVVRKEGTPVLTCWSGARSAAQLLADQDFLQAEFAWLVEDGRLLAGTLKDATTTVADDDETRPALKFDFTLNSDQRFTPRLAIPPQATLLTDIVVPDGPGEL